jgi:hypothetical protein
VVDGYGQNDLVATDEARGNTGDMSGAMGFCCRRGNDGRAAGQRNKKQ